MATKQIFTTHMPNGSNGFLNYCGPQLRFEWRVTNFVAVPWLVAGTFRNVSITHVTAPGAGKSFNYTFYKNGAATALSLTLEDTNTTVSDTIHRVTVAPGDLVYWKRTPSIGSPTVSHQRTTVEFWASEDNESGYGSMGLLTAANTFRTALLNSGQLNTGNIDVSNHEVVSVAGTVTDYAINLFSAPGAAKSHEAAIYKNGVKQDGSGGTPDTRITISGASSTSGSWSGTLTVASGDRLLVQSTPTGTPSGSEWAIGVKFVATTDGESHGGSQVFVNLPSAGGPHFTSPNQWSSLGWDTTESNVDTTWDSATDVTIRDLRISLGTATVGTGPITFTMRKASGDTAMTATMTVGQSTGSDLTNEFDMTQGSQWSMKYTFSGSPGAARIASFAYVMYAPYVPLIEGAIAIGSDVSVIATRGIALSVDGATNVHSESGVTKVYGKFAVTDYVELVDGQTAPGSTSGKARLYVDTADGDLKIIFGDGTIKTIVTD